MRLHVVGRVDELVWKRGEAIASRWRQRASPCIGLVIAVEYREVEMRARAHVGDVGEDLALRDRGAHLESRPGPDVPVLREHDSIRSLMTYEHPAAERGVDDVADDHPGRRGHHGLDARLDVHACVQPYSAGRAAPPQHRAVAVAPLAAESQAVRLPRGQWELEVVRGLDGLHDA